MNHFLCFDIKIEFEIKNDNSFVSELEHFLVIKMLVLCLRKYMYYIYSTLKLTEAKIFCSSTNKPNGHKAVFITLH